jgi:biotin synthase-related radical SAM superfamily protein
METNKNKAKTTQRTTKRPNTRSKPKTPTTAKKTPKNNTIKKETEQQRTTNAKIRMIKAMERHMCIVTTASKSAKIDRSRHYIWMNEDPEYKKAIDELSEIVFDVVESKLFEQIKSGNTTSTIFFMKCKMRGRGYIEKTEMDLNVTRPDLSDMSTDEIRQLLDSDDEQT